MERVKLNFRADCLSPHLRSGTYLLEVVSPHRPMSSRGSYIGGSSCSPSSPAHVGHVTR
jgi:hypothetical protein